jgi:RNA polymerase sigma-70 factor (ECF subfamily)
VLPLVATLVKAHFLMDSPFPPSGVAARPEQHADWLARFHEGARDAMRECYTDHFASVERAVGRVLAGADKETVIHEVFFRLMTKKELRETFEGGSFRAWICTVAKNHAIDYWRRQQFEVPAGSAEELLLDVEDGMRFDSRAEARMMIERFRAECLPDKWQKIFEVRFVQQLDQAEAARVLRMSRTTLIYQEYRVRLLLRRFFVGTASS